MGLKILNPDDRIIQGWGTVEVRDKQGELLPIEEFEKIMPIIMDRGGVLTDSHSNRVIGKILNYEIKTHPETGKKGVFLTAKIFDDYPLDDEIWQAIKNGEYTGFSFGGRGKLKEIKFDEENMDATKILEHLEGYEFSIVKSPANPYAKIEEINVLAKSEEDLKKYIRHEGNKWVVYAESGRKMGEYDTKEEALRRLRQIEYFKRQNKQKQYEEPTRMRDLLARAIYDKDFDELTDEQKNKIHEIASKIWSFKEDIQKEPDGRPPKCISEDTLVMTRRGLVPALEVSMNDEILTFNMETEELEWQKPEGIEKIDYNGKMIEYDGARFNQLVTPNHQFVVRWMKKNKWYKKDIDWIREKDRGQYLEIPLTGKWNCVTPDSINGIDTTDLTKFTAWFISEGYLDFYSARKTRNYGIVITQKKYIEEVENIMKKVFGKVDKRNYISGFGKEITRFRIDNKNMFEFLKKDIYRGKAKRIPNWIKELNSEKIKDFLMEYIKADGTFRKSGGYIIYTKELGLRDDLIEIGLKAGFSVSFRQDKRDNTWTIILKKAKTGRFRGVWKEKDYNGKVIAIKVPNETIVIARKGKVSITGNSWWDKCIARAESFATDPARFCGALWYDSERFVGGEKMREAFGKGEEINKEELKRMIEDFEIDINKGLIEDIYLKLSKLSEKIKALKKKSIKK